MWPNSEKQNHLVEKAKKISKHISLTALKHDHEGTFPHEHFKFMKDIGYLSAAVPEEYGGTGCKLTDLLLAQYEIGKGDGSTALAVGMHHMVVGTESIAKKWPEHVRREIFGEVIREGCLLNNIASEPELGSPRGGGRPFTTLTPDGKGNWILEGRKTWSTLSPALTYAITFAAVEDGTEDTARIMQRMDAEGIHIEETWDSMSMRSTGSHDIIFDKVRVSDNALLFRSNPKNIPEEPIGGSVWFPLMLSAANLGVATAARNYAIEFAINRQPTGAPAPISKIPHVREQVARMESKLLVAKRALFSYAQDWDTYEESQQELLPEVGAIKTKSIDTAIEITDIAMRVVGGVGLEKSRPLERYFRDVRSGLANPPIEGRALEQIASWVLD